MKIIKVAIVFLLIVNTSNCVLKETTSQNVAITNEIKIDKELKNVLDKSNKENSVKPLEVTKSNEVISEKNSTNKANSNNTEEIKNQSTIDLNNKIVFSFGKAGNHEIYISDIGLTNKTKFFNINNDNLKDVVSPVVSPDGKKIVFNTYKDFSLYVANIDGTNIKQISKGRSPSWSPDGKTIIYSDGRDINSISSSGLNNVKLTNGKNTCLTPSFSPDGSKIIYNSTLETFIMDKDGTNPSKLIETKNPQGGYPKFSPDGKKIAFLPSLNILFSGGSLYLSNSDGSNIQELYNPQKSNSIKSFDWSPDGKKIILSISKNDVSDLFIINLDDNDIQQITQAKEGEEYLTPKWVKLSK